MKRKKTFAFVNEYINEYELKLGEGKGTRREWIVDHPDPLGPELPYLQRHKLGKGINVVHDYWGCLDERKLDAIIAYADYISVDSRVITPEHFDLFLRKMRDHPHQLYHRALIECDTRANWDGYPGFFRSHREAMEWWKDFVLNSQVQWVDPVTHECRGLRDMRSDRLPGGNLAEYIKRGMPCREYQFVASGGEVWSLHMYLEWGFDAITLERNLLCGNVNVGIAFLRGAAHQYGDKKWGMDFTCWVDGTFPDYTPTSFDEKGRQIEGVSPDLYFREWISARMNGADFAHQIFSEVGFFNLPFRPQEKRVLSPVGKKAAEFQALLDGPLQDVGRAIVPVGVMLDRNHGWCESRWDREFALGKKIPYLPEDKSIANFFSHLFPNYELGTRGGMKFYQPDLPWFGYQDRKEALAKGADRRLQEKGILADTRYGDIVDVLVDNAAWDALSAYPLVIILGGLVLEDGHFKVLEEYIRKGGTLLLNIMHYPTEKYAFGGFALEAGYQFYEGRTTCKICGAAIEDYLYEYSAVKPLEGTRVLMHNEEDYAGFPPLAVERRLGKGRIITSLVYHYNILKGERMAPSAQHLLDHLIGPLVPYQVKGDPIQTIFSDSESNTHCQYVTLLNQHEKPWQGSVRDPTRKIASATDAVTGRPMTIADAGFSTTVEPFGVRIARVTLAG